MTHVSGGKPVLFLDANVIISAAWKDGTEIALLWKIAGVSLVTSDYVMGEVQCNLHQVAQIERLRALMRTVQVLSLNQLPEVPEASTLPQKDRPVLGAAIVAKVDHLVSGDKKHFGQWYGKEIQGVRITAPSELLAVLRKQLP